MLNILFEQTYVFKIIIIIIIVSTYTNPAFANNHECNYFGVPSIHRITAPFITSEGPIWDHRKQLLYFVDARAGKICSYDHREKSVHCVKIGGLVTTIIPSKKNPHIFTVGVNRTLLGLKWNGKTDEQLSQKVLTEVSKQYPKSFLNDGKADIFGRLWIGTSSMLSKPVQLEDLNQGILFKFTKENIDNPNEMIAPVNVSNGMAFNKANDKYYYIDSPTNKVVEYDFDARQGTIRYNRTVFDLMQHPQLTGYPDGMTIDSQDNLWIALYGGGAIIQVDTKNGNVLQTVALPTKVVSSATWGGPNFDILFVTTSRYNLTESEEKSYPAAGSVFAVTNTGASGVPDKFQNVFDGPI